MNNSSYSSPILQEFIGRFQLQLPLTGTATHHTRQAAVLIPIICRLEPTLLLTQRSVHLRKHAGQIAFPGGESDPDDASLIATALRETEEEVGIAPSAIHILGQLSPLDSVSGFSVTPIVGLIDPNVTFHSNPGEVAALFEMPLQEALQLSRYHVLPLQRAGKVHPVTLSWYQQHFIWGFTATVIRRLALQITHA